jgi:hypothetical protein
MVIGSPSVLLMVRFFAKCEEKQILVARGDCSAVTRRLSRLDSA